MSRDGDGDIVAEFDERQDWAKLTIDRPSRRNAMTAQMWSALGTEIHRVARAGCRALLIQGRGDAFAAGSDLDELAAREPSDGLAALAQNVLGSLSTAPFVTVAAILGPALGGGLEIALACDLRLAGRSATFGSPEIHFAMVPGAGATQRLPGIVGDGRAAEMILTGRVIDAVEALDTGLVTQVVDDADLTSFAIEFTEALASRDHVALQGALAALRAVRSGSRGSGYDLERFAQALCLSSGRAQEAVASWKQASE